MFRIREEQMEAFSAACLRNFMRRAVADLRETFPEETKAFTEVDLHDFVRDSMARAATYRLESERAIMCYAYLRLLLGDDFASDPKWDWVAQLLKDQSEDENKRAQEAVNRVADILSDKEP